MPTLFHRDLGGDGHPSLIILHGLLGSSRNWQTTGRDLADTYRVFALDLRNHGHSPHLAEMSFDVMVEDVIAWMDAQGIARTTLMGHSMGGKVAMLLACRYPERVERLVVVDISPSDHFVGHRAEFTAMMALDLSRLQSRTEAETQFEQAVESWGMRKFLVTNLERGEDGAWRWLINLPVLNAALPALEKNSLREDDRFDGPTLFIVGGRSTFVLPKDHAVIRGHFPRAEIEILPTSGHNPHMEVRAEFVRAILGRR
jgi:pimeloyl-ACP methyl ester carboxylesterase